MICELRAAVDDSFRRVVSAKTYEDFDGAYLDWKHALSVYRKYSDTMAIFGETVEIPAKHCTEIEKRTLFEKVAHAHRMAESIALDVGEYLGWWYVEGDVACG